MFKYKYNKYIMDLPLSYKDFNLLEKQIEEFFEKFYGYKNITTLMDFMRDMNLRFQNKNTRI